MLYCQLCAVRPYRICPHITNSTIAGKFTELEMLIDFVYKLSKIFLILRRIQPAKSQIHIAINLKYPLLLSEFKDT